MEQRGSRGDVQERTRFPMGHSQSRLGMGNATRTEGKPIRRPLEGLEGGWERRGKSKGIKEGGRKSRSVAIWDVLLPKSHSLSWDKAICDLPSEENSHLVPLGIPATGWGSGKGGKFQRSGTGLGMDGLKSRKKGCDSQFPTPRWSLAELPHFGNGDGTQRECRSLWPQCVCVGVIVKSMSLSGSKAGWESWNGSSRVPSPADPAFSSLDSSTNSQRLGGIQQLLMGSEAEQSPPLTSLARR